MSEDKHVAQHTAKMSYLAPIRYKWAEYGCLMHKVNAIMPILIKMLLPAAALLYFCDSAM